MHTIDRGAYRIFPGEGHRRPKGSVFGGHHGECGARAYNGGLGAEPPVGSRGRAGTDSLNNNCICLSALRAAVMIWEKFYVEIQGVQVTPVAPSWGRP